VDESENGGGILIAKSGGSCSSFPTYDCGEYIYSYSISMFPLQIHMGVGCGGVGGGFGYVACGFARVDENLFHHSNTAGNCYPKAYNELLDFSVYGEGSVINPAVLASTECFSSSCGGSFCISTMPVIAQSVVDKVPSTNHDAIDAYEFWGTWLGKSGRLTASDGLWVIDNNFSTMSITGGGSFPFDFNGDLLTDWFVAADGKIYYNNMTAEAAPETYTSYVEYWEAGEFLSRKLGLSGQSCKIGKISSTDIDDDNFFDIISGAGVIKLDSGVVVNLSLNSEVIIVDINNDGGGDFVASRPGNTKFYITRSDPESVSWSKNVTFLRMSPCSVDENGLLQVGIWGTAVDPTTVTYELDAGDLWSETHSYDYGLGYRFTHQYDIPGTYTVTGKICDSSVSSSCASGVCTVIANFTDLRAGSCSLGDDGTFDWTDSVSNHGWYGDFTFLEPEDGILYFLSDSQGVNLLHSASCNKQTLTVDAKVFAASDADFSIIIGAHGDNGIGESIIGIVKFKNGMLQTTSDGSTFYQTNVSVSSTWKEYSFVADVSSQKFYVYVKDFVSGDYILLDELQFLTTGISELYNAYIQLKNDASGIVKIDWIQVSGSGLKTVKAIEPTPVQVIAGEEGCTGWETLVCDPAAELSFTDAVKAGDMTSAYPDVYAYCLGCDNSRCSDNMLMNIAVYKPDCYKQAFSYCVDVLYPGENINNNAGPGGGVAGQGTLACQALFSAKLTVDKVAFPVIDSFWKVIANNWFFMMLAVVIIVLVAAFARKK
jgi:hypothetical protein